MVAVDGSGAWSVATPRLGQTFTGAGDLTAAVFLAHLLRTDDLPAALASTAAAVFGVLRVTVESGRSELALVQAQDELVHPSADVRRQPGCADRRRHQAPAVPDATIRAKIPTLRRALLGCNLRSGSTDAT